MATENVLTNVSLEASGDLSADQYRGVKLASDGEVQVCDSNGEQAYGVLQNDPDAVGKAATVCIAGLTKAQAGGSISIGDSVAVDADGDFITAATSDIIVGVAVTASGGDGEIFTLDFRTYMGTA